MNISSMLVRLQTKLNLHNLADEILLLPPQPQHLLAEVPEINLLVGYSNSHNSQLALDLTLCIALQTKLVVNKPVTVQVVYVVEETAMPEAWQPTSRQNRTAFARSQGAAVIDRPTSKTLRKQQGSEMLSKAEQFEKADSILWQARSLAEEWRGSLKTHLRFGDLAIELGQVAAAEQATMLIVGCESRQHPLVKRLGKQFPCPILGIPTEPEEG